MFFIKIKNEKNIDAIIYGLILNTNETIFPLCNKKEITIIVIIDNDSNISSELQKSNKSVDINGTTDPNIIPKKMENKILHKLTFC